VEKLAPFDEVLR